MSTIRNVIIVNIILVVFLISSCVPIDKPRIFKAPLFDAIYREVPVIDDWRDDLLDRIEVIVRQKKFTPEHLDLMYILRNTEYAVYLAYHVAIAGGDVEAATHYKHKLTDIYKAMETIINQYAISSKGNKYEF